MTEEAEETGVNGGPNQQSLLQSASLLLNHNVNSHFPIIGRLFDCNMMPLLFSRFPVLVWVNGKY
jgi:hypothetical protein